MMQYLSNLTFASPWWFLALGVIPAMVWWQYFAKKKQPPTVIISDLQAIKSITSWKEKVYPWLPILQIVSTTLFIIAMARPQLSLKEEKVKAEGIDIMMVMDVSSSMLSRDFDPDRLEVSKLVATEFVEKRVHDRIGLVVFSGEAFTQCPLTTDHKIITDFLSNLQVGMLEDGTAIGMGLATAVNRLKDSEAKSKIIILLTDGVNNSGLIDPMTALEIAKAYKARVYTIGVGTQGQANYPVTDQFGRTVMQQMPVQIDETLLKQISTETGGKYFRATDNNSLRNIYQEIDKLEKVKIDINTYKRYTELFFMYAAIGLLALLLELILQHTYFKSLP